MAWVDSPISKMVVPIGNVREAIVPKFMVDFYKEEKLTP
jgi:hypothetical protein